MIRKRSKYKAIRVSACGRCWQDITAPPHVCLICPTTAGKVVFDSKGEFRRWHELLILERAGDIRNLTRQPSFAYPKEGKPDFVYRADFSYRRDQEFITEDFKGFRTPLYKLKKKLIERAYDIEILET